MHRTTTRFWKCFEQLPEPVQKIWVEIPVEDLADVKNKLLEAYREMGIPEDQIPAGLK